MSVSGGAALAPRFAVCWRSASSRGPGSCRRCHFRGTSTAGLAPTRSPRQEDLVHLPLRGLGHLLYPGTMSAPPPLGHTCPSWATSLQTARSDSRRLVAGPTMPVEILSPFEGFPARSPLRELSSEFAARPRLGFPASGSLAHAYRHAGVDPHVTTGSLGGAGPRRGRRRTCARLWSPLSSNTWRACRTPLPAALWPAARYSIVVRSGFTLSAARRRPRWTCCKSGEASFHRHALDDRAGVP